jgi:hypothetical protein
MWLYLFAFPLAMNESSCCSALWQAFGVISVLDFGYSDRYVVVSHYCFNLHFLDNIGYGASFHILFCNLCICISSLVKGLLRSLTHF